MNKINRKNKNWNNQITDEEILDREFTTHYLIRTNQHIDLFKKLKDELFSNYKVVAEFKYLGFNGPSIICNNQVLVRRPNKFSDFVVGDNVKVIKHNFSHKQGGSHSTPAVSYIGAECTLEFISYGLPFVDRINGWSINIINLEKID